MFDKAARLKFRFNTPKGLITTEDLWDLPLTGSMINPNLDDIAVSLSKQLKATDETSFVNTTKTVDSTLQTKFDIVKHIIDIKLAERNAASIARANKEKKDQILALIATKQNEQLAGTSLEDLMKMAEAL